MSLSARRIIFLRVDGFVDAGEEKSAAARLKYFTQAPKDQGVGCDVGWVEAKRAFVALAGAHHGSTCAVLMWFRKGAQPILRPTYARVNRQSSLEFLSYRSSRVVRLGSAIFSFVQPFFGSVGSAHRSEMPRCSFNGDSFN